jgi:glycosyltransferase involved in cell wall biosynthesis
MGRARAFGTVNVRPLRVGVICDFLEEKWPSMDLIADMLLENLQVYHPREVRAVPIRPRFVRRLSYVSARKDAFNADRVLNRFVDYPKFIRRLRNEFDIFHIVDHSYGHLVRHLPNRLSIVICHDLDTFESVLEPDLWHRSSMFNAMTRQILKGLQSAAVVSCDSLAIQKEILAHRLVSAERLVVIGNGVHPVFSPKDDPVYDRGIVRLIGWKSSSTDLLHVASTIPRKRIDVLLRVFAVVREKMPSARLIRVGGPFTKAQKELVNKLRIDDSVLVMPYLDRRSLAAVYRRAAMLLLPSEAEGFGLPVIEAMACGTPVVASDIPALREAGGTAAEYCSVADVAGWSKTVIALAGERGERPLDWQERKNDGLRWAGRFSFREQALRNVSIYRELTAS